MEQISPTRSGVIAAIEGLRAERDMSLRALADDTLIPLATLHRRLKGGGFTLSELERIAVALGTTPSLLIAQAERGAA